MANFGRFHILESVEKKFSDGVKPKPRRHHFLSEFYLNGFARDGMLWLYDREKKEFRRQPPNKTAVEKDYCTVLNKDGEMDFGIEEFLSQIESRAKPVIAKLEARENITPDERFNLACFVSLLMCRTPKFEREIKEISDATHKLVVKEMIPTVEERRRLVEAGHRQLVCSQRRHERRLPAGLRVFGHVEKSPHAICPDGEVGVQLHD